MIVSWKWLEQYVDLKMSHDELVDRLTMSGLNHEGTFKKSDLIGIDLEVTSNRPDCLGHIGVAREVAVLYDLPLTIPDPKPATTSQAVGDICSVEIQCPELCYRYTARVLKGVKVGPSPDWLVDRLQAAQLKSKDGDVLHGYQPINNIVDATNYVMFECGQPLHAFDLAKVKGNKVVVREAAQGEEFHAIDHKTYGLHSGMCVIADESDPIAIGGVMGGADSEVSDSTTDILLEAAFFNPLSVRHTARTLNLFSPSSFRFERTIDSTQLDWASRRCCEIILETGGGELLEGIVDAGAQPQPRQPVTLRLSQLERVLGIEIPADFVPKTLEALGCSDVETNAGKITVTPPTYRADLTREVDLVEEVGRIYGFDKVPDTANVPMAASLNTPADRVLDKVRSVLTGNGFDEAIMASMVPQVWADAFSPWTEHPSLISSQPMLGVLEKASQNSGAVELVRRSLVPSLLECRRINEYRSNVDIELFETAKVYLSMGGDESIPDQPMMVSMVSGRDFFSLKGVVESLVDRISSGAQIVLQPFDHPLLDVNQSGELSINGTRLGFIGAVSESGKKQFGLRSAATIAELDFRVLQELAILIPLHQDQSKFQSTSRDFNFILDNAVHWSDLEQTVRAADANLIESIHYRETFRDEAKDGPNKKRLLMSVVLRSGEATLTGEQAEEVCQKIVADCGKQHDAALVG